MNLGHKKALLNRRLRRMRSKIQNVGIDRKEKMMARISEIEKILAKNQ